MDDLISRREATNELWSLNDQCDSIYYTKCIHDAVYALEILPSAQRWIPCSEQLPDYNVPVLTWDGATYQVEKRIPCIIDDDAEPIFSDWWVSDEYDEYESLYYPNLRDGAAIAWMPLPEPYREDGDGDG